MEVSIESNSKGGKKLKRKEVLEKKKAIDALIKTASIQKDHLASFPPFRNYNRNGLSVYLESGSGEKLSSPMKAYIQTLLKVNMEGPYGQEWATQEKIKRREMVASEARYIFVRDAPNVSAENISSASEKDVNFSSWTGDGDPVVGFVHYRFVVEEDVPVCYVYELQLECHVQGKGLGKFLMQLIELIACKSRMGAVMLTVQKVNILAMDFYMNKLRYVISTISPSKVEPLLAVEKSYEILCKTFDHASKVKLTEMEGEAVSELLSRLPAKSLLRFESVSKGWRDLISDDTLRRLQCHRVKAVISGFFFQATMAVSRPTPVKYVIMNSDQAVVQDKILDFLPEKVEVIASSNGLLCCHHSQKLGVRVDNLIYVCNPANQEYVQIEWPNGSDKHQYFALAFNPFHYPMDDLSSFKLVCMSKEDMLSCLFQVYSSKSKEWRKLDVYKFGYDNRISWPDGQVVFASRVLHWLTNGNVLAFDVETEQPYFISLPVERIHKNYGLCEVCIGESEGRLLLIVIPKAGLRVWILGDGQKWVVKHWVSLSRIEEEYPHFLYTDAKITASLAPTNIVIPTWIEPVVYKDEILLIKLRHHFSFENEKLETGTKMYLYNFDTRKMEELFNIDKLGSCTGFLRTVPYCMSLAPLGSAQVTLKTIECQQLLPHFGM